MFNFPKIDREKSFKYSKNFLKTIIIQVKFPQKDNIENFESHLDAILLESHPNKKNIMSGELHMKIEKTPILMSNSSAAKGYEYRSNDGNSIYSIVNDIISLSIAGSNYSNFNEAFNEFYNNCKALNTEINITELNRIAIRKINIFEYEMTDNLNAIDFLSYIFNDSVVNNFQFFPNLNKMTSGISQLAFNEEAFQMNLAYGLLKEKSKNGKNMAVLDIDLYKTGLIELDNLSIEMNKINDEIYNVFEFMISDNLRSILNSED